MNFKIIQSGLNRYDEREVMSIGQLKSLSNDMNVRYIRIENQPFNWDAPVNNIYKGWVGFYRGRTKEKGTPGLTDRHYGAWLSHKQSIMLGFSDSGHSLICESDCRILDMDLFKERLKEAVEVLDENPEYHIVRFEPTNNPPGFVTNYNKQISENIFECDRITLGHCYLINEKSKDFFVHLYDENGWTTPDDWLLFNFNEKNIPFLGFKEILTSQYDGFSEIDKIEKKY